MKGLLKFITCGSVDDGKSTLIGHILYDAKLLYADQKRALELESRVGSRGGEIDYSLLLDGLMAEREQGITIDVAYRYFTTDNRSFIVADTPGHEEYTRNMAVGASFADLAVILIDAEKGVVTQTKRHARICELMGIKHFVFAVNKMDLVEYSERRFAEIKEEILDLQKELSLADIAIIPLSATEGDNVTAKSQNTPWYEGKSLLDYLENVEIDSIEEEKGFYMPVQRVCRPDHTFRGFQGQIESGLVRVDDEITALPSNEKVRVKSINIGDKDVKEAEKGQPVTIQLDKEVDVSRGCVLSKDSSVKLSSSFEAEILWMDDEKLVCGKEYLVKIGTKLISGYVTKLADKIDINSGKYIKAEFLSKNEIGLCSIVLSEKVVIDEFNNHKALGEFILIDRVSNMTSACGVVKDVVNEEDNINNIAFIYDDFRVRGDIFEEFYYNSDSLSINKYKNVERQYTIGDEIPTSGESYNYPDNFDILVFRDWSAVIIRDKKIVDIKSIGDYQYDGQPIVNGRGFSLKAHSEDEFKALLSDKIKYKEDDEAFLEKWVNFGTYRKVIFHKPEFI